MKQTIPDTLYLHKKEWEKEIREFNVIEWGRIILSKQTWSFRFRSQSQPVFNKNFELLRDDLAAQQKHGLYEPVFLQPA